MGWRKAVRVSREAIRRTAIDLCLLLVCCVAGLALCEACLRLFYPKYRHVAEYQFHQEAARIWARTPNSQHWMQHPDTGVTHLLHHNNLALRQHRNFSEADLVGATNIGVFGDSSTENIHIAAQYSFTEPLDYLLNQGQKRLNVLNFGVHGYGPGQLLLHYEHFRYAEHLDHVLYVYCGNDLKNISQTGLFYTDDAGQLVRNETIPSWWKSLISKLHISYLVLDVSARLSSLLAETAGDTENLREGRRRRDEGHSDPEDALDYGRPDHDSQPNSLEIFRQLLRRWKSMAESNGSTFSVVLLPIAPLSFLSIFDLLQAEDVEIIDLYACFENHDSAHNDRGWRNSPYRFRNNPHWNEAGNRLAAICLYRMLEEKMGFPSYPKRRLQETLFQYYAAFEGETVLKAAGGRRRGLFGDGR